MTMDSSLHKKEKLRKKLQKLFSKQETLKQSNCKIVNSQHKDKMNNIKKTKSPEQQPVKERNSLPNSSISKNATKQQQPQKKGNKIAKDGSMQNGFVGTPRKQNFDSKSTKSEGFSIKNDIQKQNKLKQEKCSTVTNRSEKISSKQCPPNNTSPSKHKKIKKQVEKNSKIKETTKADIEIHSPKNEIKSHQTSTFKPSDSSKNGNTKTNEMKKKKSKKRAVSADIINNEPIVSNKKKEKLTKKNDRTNKIVIKSNKKQEYIADESDSSSSQFDDEYDVNGMIGCVRGGDFDSNHEDEIERKFWIPDENSSENEYSSDNILQGVGRTSQTDLEQYDQNKPYDSDVDYFDSEDSSSDDFDDYFTDSYEEEEENYSDFDENDYEEEEDSYNYTLDDDNDYCSNSDDDDYKLPQHVPEDLIIHTGTANKRDLKPEDNVSFDSENGESQIVELENQHTVKVICQPKAYEKEELLKLKYEEKSSGAITFHKKETTSIDPEECPKLVPIVDENGFQLYNPNEDMHDEVDELEQEDTEELSLEEYDSDISLGSEYTEVNSEDTDSFLSEDVNEKYLKRSHHDDSDSDDSIDENMWNKKHKVDIIDATGYKCENEIDNTTDSSDISLNDDMKQIPSIKLYENVDLKTESSIFSTTIIESATAEHEVMEELQMEIENRAEHSPKMSKSSEQKLGDYNTKFFNALDSNLVMVLLKDPFYIYGTVRLTLLAGAVELYGHSLTLNREVEIFSPRGCSVIEIASANNTSNASNENLKLVLESYEQHFALADLKTIVNLYNCERDAVVLLKRNESRKKVVQQFKKFMNENVFPNISNINVDRPLYNSEYLLRCMINTSAQEEKCLRLPDQWKQLSITTNSRVMLTGGKGVGKSTLLRYLINRHLPQDVLLIDLDIGQPEVFVPQTISCTIVKQPLLGPGFLLNLQPEISYAVGHTNIALCAHKYIEAVRSLIAHCKSQEEYKEIPWLINTMGYNKGFGLELISVIAQELPLTDVVQLQSTKDINNFDSILHSHVLICLPHIFFSEAQEQTSKENLNYRLHIWQSAVQQESRYQKEWEMSAKDFRFAILLARLSDALQGHADWLSDIKPLSASLDEIRIINLTASSPSASLEDLQKSVEANLVYLCHYEDDFKPLKCLGIGVVKAIDFHVRQLYLIPALPHTQLKNVNCLAIGEMPLPTSLYTNQGPRVKNIAPFVYNTLAANASKAIKQIYHRPSKFLTGKRKSLD